MIEKDAQISQLTEDNVVAKVAELMETLDQVKKYNALTGSLKKFVLIVISSVLVFFAIAASVGFLNLVVPLERPQFIVIAILSLFIPIIGIGLGVFLIRKKVSSVKMGDWQPELSNGFPSALKMLLELDWDSTFEEIFSEGLATLYMGCLKRRLIGWWYALRLVSLEILLVLLFCSNRFLVVLFPG